jgi:mono/diheme cytochrome c family protein
MVAAALAMLAAAHTSMAQFAAATLDDYSGAELFERFCASCHGTGARGNGPVASSLNTAVPDLTVIASRNGGEFPVTLVRDVIDGRGIDVQAHGTRAMPVWGYEFWVEEGADVVAQTAVREAIAKLVDYLRSIQRAEPARVADAVPAAD